MMISILFLELVVPRLSDCTKYNQYLIEGIAATKEFEPEDLAPFFATILHESNNFKHVEENLSYSAKGLLKTWPKRYTPSLAENHARKPKTIGNYVYSGRMGNGDSTTGDGYKYRGRGLIQITGKANYELMSRVLNINCVEDPDLLLQPKYAALSAIVWYRDHVLSRKKRDIVDVTLVVNGGTNNIEKRKEELLRVQGIIKGCLN